MIRFSKSNVEEMDVFRNDIRAQIIQMASNAISPIYGNWESFDEEIARKLNDNEIEYNEANKKFVEDFYICDLDGLTIDGNTVVFEDSFNVEGTCNDDSYDLASLVAELRKLYPDVEVFGCGNIDYHFSAINYILIASGDNIIFGDDENDGEYWVCDLCSLAEGETIEDLAENNEDFTIEKLYEDMTRFLSEHDLKLSVVELLDKLGLEELKNLFE